jgi:hypothetical protein
MTQFGGRRARGPSHSKLPTSPIPSFAVQLSSGVRVIGFSTERISDE